MNNHIRSYDAPFWRLVLLAGTFFGLWLFAVDAGAGTIAEFDTSQTAIIDSLIDNGQIARPQICPADSNWVAYEIHHGESVQLYLYNLSAGAGYSIIAESSDDSITSADSSAPRINYDLSWCPRTVNGKLWAAYVSSLGGVQDIYLYDVSSDRSYGLLGDKSDSSGQGFQIWGPPDWSPDGKCLTFSAALDGDADIYIYRGLDRALENPNKKIHGLEFQPLIVGPDNQFGPAWCPVTASGYLAYTEQTKGEGRLRVKVYDPLISRSFEFSKIDTTYDYFAPTWSAGGDRLAFYKYPHNDGGFSRFSGPADGIFEIGVALVGHSGDTLTIASDSGAIPGRSGNIDVIPDFDRLIGPAWLPGGRYIAVSVYDEPGPTRLAIVSLTELEAGQTDPKYWLRGFGGDYYDFPRDLNIVDRNISFTYGISPREYLLVGKIAPSLQLVTKPEYIEVANNRRLWWAGYAGGEGAKIGFLSKIGRFLWSPIAGPDIGINRGIVPVAGGAVLLAMLINGSGHDGGGGVTSPRDWTPPDFPDPGKRRIGISLNLGL